uniref:Uncharacterized protein n=1 Tax=Planktothricoides sp. SpSt-374 TaxID=2282167 RepID=A0A7C3VSN9_9CYAN
MINYQLSIINYQLSIINYQLNRINLTINQKPGNAFSFQISSEFLQETTIRNLNHPLVTVGKATSHPMIIKNWQSSFLKFPSGDPTEFAKIFQGASNQLSSSIDHQIARFGQIG